MDFSAIIAEELKLETWRVAKALELMDQGGTIPFIARYRKDQTGTLNEIELRDISHRRDYLQELTDRKETILKSIEEQGKLTPELKAQDSLLICVEPYCELPVDKDAFKGEIPDLVGLLPYTPFEFYIKRKLFLHNGGHALCAYLGNLKGYEYIWQAIADPEIYETAKAAMNCSAQALIKKFGEEIRENVENNVVDLLFRFQN